MVWLREGAEEAIASQPGPSWEPQPGPSWEPQIDSVIIEQVDPIEVEQPVPGCEPQSNTFWRPFEDHPVNVRSHSSVALQSGSSWFLRPEPEEDPLKISLCVCGNCEQL
ncbi:uncharacterized protein LOC127290882 [Leptopilina boulardi]|uniref:uncharacterized protein LOC127290882 n=1 Tax=Leptopilina boulardi TaxID=63433 RepID=UPI0021F69C9B|nr:uncharacterized protein LOC127290882 [Leptopilina boulardi]